MIFIDTPLDIAMARRMLRDIAMTTDPLQRVKDELSGYQNRARPLYEYFQRRMRETADLIIDGTLGVDHIVESIRSEVSLRLGKPIGP